MNEDEGDLDELTDLRGQVATPESPPKPAVDLEELSPQDLRRLVHDLRVRQVELEMQNEELRQARRKLQASRDKYFDLYDLAPVGYLSVSQEGVILDANLTAAALLGVETGGLVARSLSHFVAQDDRDTFHTHHRQACEARTRQTCELKMSRGDGSQFHARLESMAVQRDVGLGNESIQSSGDLVCRVALSDVSEWVQAENALRETNTRLDALIEAIPDVIYFKDAQGRNLAVNRAYEKLLGLEKKDILGKTDEQLLPPILAEQCWKSDQEVIKARQLVRIEEQLAGEQGERIFFDTVKVPLLDEQGNVKGLVGISRDVTERVQVEEALRESEERYRTMIDAMDDLIHVVDRDLRLVLFNEACHKAFVEAGIAHDPTGLGIMEFCPFLSDEARLEYERVLKTGKPLLTEEATKVRGRTVWTETRKIPILDEAGKTQRVVTIVRDITEQVQASDMLGTYASQQAALLQLSASLAALLDEKDVCCEVVRELHDTLGYEHLGLYLVDEGAGERVLYANIGWPDPEPLLRILPGHGLSERPLLDSQLHYTPDVTRDPRYIPGLDEGGAEVDVPLRVGDKILGVLVIESHKPGAFDEGDFAVLTAVANQAGVAIERAREHQAVKRAQARYRSLFEGVPVGLYRSTPGGQILDANQALVQMSGFPDRESLLAANVLDMYIDLRAREQMLAQAEREGGMLNLVQQMRRYDGTVAWAEVNFRVVRDADGQVLYYEGSLEDITERVRAEAALQRRNRELTLLNQASRAFSSSLDLDQVLATVLRETCHLLDAASGSVWLVDPRTGEIVCRQDAGPHSEIVRGWRLAPGQGVAGWMVETGESVIVPDTRADAHYFRELDEQTGLELRSLLGVPLRVKDKVIGVLHVTDTAVDRFEPADLALVEPLAATAAIAIENAQLYEQARRDAETHAVLLHEVNHRVKNNLTSILGVLSLEMGHDVQSVADFQAVMYDLQARIRGLATIHDMLSATRWAPLPLDDLVEQVIHAALGGSSLRHKIQVTVTSPDEPLLVVPKQATALAVITNELTTNSIKYAFRGRDRGRIDVQITVGGEDRQVTLKFRNDGPGWPEDVLQGRRKSVGLHLVRLTVRSPLRGQVMFHNDGGAATTITFTLALPDTPS